MLAIAEEGEVLSPMSRDFLERYRMSASTVQTALKALLELDFVTRREDNNAYIIYDRFLDIWLRRK